MTEEVIREAIRDAAALTSQTLQEVTENVRNLFVEFLDEENQLDLDGFLDRLAASAKEDIDAFVNLVGDEFDPEYVKLVGILTVIMTVGKALYIVLDEHHSLDKFDEIEDLFEKKFLKLMGGQYTKIYNQLHEHLSA
jgi:chorismate mutase